MKEEGEDLFFHSDSYDSVPMTIRIHGGMEDRDAAYGPQPPASSKDAPMCASEKLRREKKMQQVAKQTAVAVN